MIVLAKDKKTQVETVWFTCTNTILMDEIILDATIAESRWTFRAVEDQEVERDFGRDPVWKLK